MAVMKRQVWGDWDRGVAAANDDAVTLMRASLRRPDFKEGVASFLQKRLPDFTPVNPDA
jgi:enoyl-CoA hydratase/carnithine racemase